MKKPTFNEWRETWQQYKLQAAFAGDQVRKYQHLLETQLEPGNLRKCLSKWHALQLELHKCLLQDIERAERWQLAEIAVMLHYRQELKALQGEESPTNNNQ